ncbi:MAG: toll/interleukin-1 receptor domain-containing protein [Mogibacterium sp.]|nr:toll/interleukin-1 receptor domain-containing protein [Mogibacterium sp.]
MYDYDVFFSYRHRPLDSEITQKLFNMAENYRLPESLRARGLQGVRRAFRDTEELPVSRILTDTIDKALHSTNCLVVVCSTDTPSSEWVDREVATFIELGRADRVFPILISGDPETSFPDSMKLIPDIGDRLMDIRVDGNDRRKMMSLAETEMLRVIACVAGCSEDELVREHGIEQSRRTIRRGIYSAAAFVLILAVSLSLMIRAHNYRNEAEKREAASMKILNELTYGLPDRLSDVPGSYSRIRDILYSNTEDINKILRLTRNREAGEYEAAVNYEKLATAENVLGMHDEALESENTAIALFETLEKSGYGKAGAGTASAYNNRAILLNSAGRYVEAGTDYDKAIELQQALGSGDRLVLARMIFNSGSNAVDMGDGDLAAERFDQSLDLLYNMERSADVLDALSTLEYNYGVLLYRSGLYDDAAGMLSDACDDLNDLIRMNDIHQNRSNYIQATSMLAACLTDAGRYDEADRCYDEAIKAAEIMAQDEENISYQQTLAELYNNRGLSRNIRGDYAAADEDYDAASAVYEKIYIKTGSDPDHAAYAVSLLNTGENAFKAHEYDRSEQFFIRGLGEYSQVSESLGEYHRAQYLAWRSYYELIHLREYNAALASASSALELQPDNMLVKLNYAYACLYSGNSERAVSLFREIASSGLGEVDTIKRDLEAQEDAGMVTDEINAVINELQLF